MQYSCIATVHVFYFICNFLNLRYHMASGNVGTLANVAIQIIWERKLWQTAYKNSYSQNTDIEYSKGENFDLQFAKCANVFCYVDKICINFSFCQYYVHRSCLLCSCIIKQFNQFLQLPVMLQRKQLNEWRII